MLKKRLAQIILLFSVVIGFSLIFYTSQPNKVLAQTAPPPNFKVAFIGDTGEGNNFQNVLNLIKAEGADLVLHQGDFSYDGVTSWTGKIDSTLGANFPYLGSVGNHDTNNWGDIRSGCTASTFAGYFRCKLDRIGVTAELGSNNQLYAVTYQGLRIVFANENPGTIGADWINQKLSGEDRKSTRLNSSHMSISYAVFCLKKETSSFVTSLNFIIPHSPNSTSPATQSF